MIKTLKEADAIIGGLGKPSKMPGYAYGIPAKYCKVGAVLHLIPGSVCHSCYALKGRYLFKNVADAQERRFKAVMEEPRWVEAMTFAIKKRNCDYFRWHDSGDLQDRFHLENIVEVCKNNPDTKFWLPTREKQLIHEFIRYGGVFPPNLVVRVSGAMIDGWEPVNFPHTSTVTTNEELVTCPAPRQGNSCGSCRACWDSTVRNVSYSKH